MTTGNKLNRDKTISELANEIEQNGYDNLTNDEINKYIETKIELAVNTAIAKNNTEKMNEDYKTVLDVIKKQAEDTEKILKLEIEKVNKKAGVINE